MNHKCKSCDYVTSLLTLGDTHFGCANCGSLKGFEDTNEEESK